MGSEGAADRHAHGDVNYLVPVVDHFLEPHAFMQHPHDYEAALVTGGEFAIVLVPSGDNDSTLQKRSNDSTRPQLLA